MEVLDGQGVTWVSLGGTEVGWSVGGGGWCCAIVGVVFPDDSRPSGLHVSHCTAYIALFVACVWVVQRPVTKSQQQQQQRQRHRNINNNNNENNSPQEQQQKQQRDAGMLLRVERTKERKSKSERAYFGVQLLTKLPRCRLCCSAAAALPASLPCRKFLWGFLSIFVLFCFRIK